MSHLIDPCLRATKIAHGIRRGIDGISPLSGLVPELRILIQEQKNVLTSLKRGTFEKEEAAKHLAIYAKTEGPDIADTLSKLSILIQKAADLERIYANSLAQSRELFKEIRVAEDENYSIRKRKLDLEQKLALDKSSWHHSTASLASASSGKAGSVNGPQELHPEMKMLRQETIKVENELEDLKRTKIKKAARQQLDALEKLGKELIIIAHYGNEVMSYLDDTPTPAGTHADDRFALYDDDAKTSYAVKACLDTFKTWPEHEPKVQISEIDLGDFPRDNKQAMDAMLKDLALKSGSDWYALQSPSSTKAPTGLNAHSRTGSISSTASGSASPRSSMSSAIATTTYVDGVPMVQVINEIPPTPESEKGPGSITAAPAVNPTSENTENSNTTATPAVQEPIPIFVVDSTASSLGGAGARSTADEGKDSFQAVAPGAVTPSSPAGATGGGSAMGPSSRVTTPDISAVAPSPFVPQSTYKPATTYQAGHGHDTSVDSYVSSPPRSRPQSGEHHFTPHPLLMQQPQQQHYPPQMYPPGPPCGFLPSQMAMPTPVHMPMPMTMPIPHIPGSPNGSNHNGSKRHSQPISVSFPVGPPVLATSLPDQHSASATSQPIPSPSQLPPRRSPHAVLPPAEPGFRVPVGAESPPVSQQQHPAAYDGPPPDYAEASMQPPAEKRDEKKGR